MHQVSPLPEGDDGTDYPAVADGTGERGANVDEALTWTQYPPRPGRSVEAVAGADSARPIRRWGAVEQNRFRGDVDVEAIICAEGTPWPCEWALALAFCESSFNVEAWATEMVDGVQHYFHGWFQLISTSPDPGPLADPVYNTERAAWKYIYEGTGAWPRCPRNGGY